MPFWKNRGAWRIVHSRCLSLIYGFLPSEVQADETQGHRQPLPTDSLPIRPSFFLIAPVAKLEPSHSGRTLERVNPCIFVFRGEGGVEQCLELSFEALAALVKPRKKR